MRKYLVAGLAASVAVVGATTAFAQDPAPSVSATAKLTPSKAGSKTKAKNVKLTVHIENLAASKTSAKTIEISLPKTITASGKGFKTCSAETLQTDGPGGCNAKAIVGRGTSSVTLGPRSADPQNIDLAVTAVVASKKEINFYVKGQGGFSGVNGVVLGKLGKAGGKYGQKLTLTIPDRLVEPVTGSFTALNNIDTTLGAKAGKNYLLSTTGCKSKKQGFGFKLGYVPNPTAPAVTSASTTATAKCS